MNNRINKSWQKRGYIVDEDLIQFQLSSFNELEDMIYSINPRERSIAIRILSCNYYKTTEEELTMLFLDILKKDKALYTRIEAQTALRLVGEIM